MRLVNCFGVPTGIIDWATREQMRLLFVITVLYAGFIPWLASHPPMVDLPQHAGQVALLHGLLEGNSKWGAMLEVNFFTPYLFGYGLAFLLSCFMPVLAAMKLMLTLSYYAFVLALVYLRRAFSGDGRLDWLFVPGFFGFAYSWGMFTFLVTASLCILFVSVALRYALSPGLGRGIAVASSGVFLFFSHGLVFLYSNLIGVSFLAYNSKNLRGFIRNVWPFAISGIVFLSYVVIRLDEELAVPYFMTVPAIIWRWDESRLAMVYALLGSGDGSDLIAGLLGGFMLCAPFVLGARLNSDKPMAILPFVVTLCVIAFAPHYALKNSFLYERFSLFVLPSYALIYVRHSESQDVNRPLYIRALRAYFIPVLCWVMLAVNTVRHVQFSAESSQFSKIVQAVQASERVMYVASDPDSLAAHNPFAYLHYALWYQVEQGGFVDPNFAWFMPQIVRFKNNSYPKVQPNFNETGEKFDWEKHQGEIYRYFFVRSKSALNPDPFVNSRCQVDLLDSAEEWSVYERRECY